MSTIKKEILKNQYENTISKKKKKKKRGKKSKFYH